MTERIVAVFEALAAFAILLFFSGAALRYGQLTGRGLPADLGIAWSTRDAVSVSGTVVAVGGGIALAAITVGAAKFARWMGGKRPLTKKLTRYALRGLLTILFVGLLWFVGAGRGLLISLVFSAALVGVVVGVGGADLASVDPNKPAGLVLVCAVASVVALACAVGYQHDEPEALPTVLYQVKGGKSCRQAEFLGQAGDNWVFVEDGRNGDEDAYYLMEDQGDTKIRAIGFDVDVDEARCSRRPTKAKKRKKKGTKTPRRQTAPKSH